AVVADDVDQDIAIAGGGDGRKRLAGVGRVVDSGGHVDRAGRGMVVVDDGADDVGGGGVDIERPRRRVSAGRLVVEDPRGVAVVGGGGHDSPSRGRAQTVVGGGG